MAESMKDYETENSFHREEPQRRDVPPLRCGNTEGR